jgi:hypothetical protein
MNYVTVDHTWVETTLVDGALVERECHVQLKVGGPADLRMGMRRSLLIEEQKLLWGARRDDLVGQGADQMEMDAEYILRVGIYPAFIAAVVSQEGFAHWPIGFNEFMTLPEELGTKLEDVVFELNAHWVPKIEPDKREQLEEARKKAMSGTSELENG